MGSIPSLVDFVALAQVVTRFIPPPMALSRGSSVGIATGYGLNDRDVGFQVPVERRIFISPYPPHWLWGPPSLLSSGYRGGGAPSLAVKRHWHEDDHSPPTVAGFDMVKSVIHAIHASPTPSSSDST
jgi:hypothetical protein